MKWFHLISIIGFVFFLSLVFAGDLSNKETIRISNDTNIVSNINVINGTILEITIDKRAGIILARNYKWDMALCNLTSSNVKYMNEDNQGGFNFSTAINLSYGKLTNWGLNSSWCRETSNVGYVLFSGGSVNQLPKKFRLLISENSSFKVYLGSGTEETIVTSEYNDRDTTTMICADNQSYIFDNNWLIAWNVGNETVRYNGSFIETRYTYQDFPRCISEKWMQWHNNGSQGEMPEYEINMTCLTTYCTEIIELNTLTGEITKIWKKGDIW